MAIGPIEGNLPLMQPKGTTDADFVARLKETQTPGQTQGVSFEDVIGQAILNTNQRIHAATEAGQAFAAGKTDDIHGTMLAMSEADISLRFVGNVKNKVVDAFYELWRMSI
ncbi:MAG: flagellar hook-basal body complex protein FliE [Polyangiaceae bacterium]|nr:flagellar hook-basal body complex protein FliE [Polyangiaceae bacterium]